LQTADSKTTEKVFLYRIVTGDEKWIFYDNSKKKKYYAKPGQSLPSTSTSTSRPNIHGSKIMLCIWWDQEGLVYYEFTAETWRFHYERSVSTTIDSFELCIARKTEYEQRYDKVLLHDNAQPHVAKVVKKYLEMLKWNVLPYPPYSLDIVPSDYCPKDAVSHRFISFVEIEN